MSHPHPDDPSNWHPKMKGDISEACETFKREAFPKYRGKQYSQREGKFWFRGQAFSTLEGIKSEIDRFLDDTEKQFPNIIKPPSI